MEIAPGVPRGTFNSNGKLLVRSALASVHKNVCIKADYSRLGARLSSCALMSPVKSFNVE